MSSLYVLYETPELNLRHRRAATFPALKQVAADLRKWNDRRLARRELRAMPDHLLADMGIERGQIDEVVDNMRHL